MPALFDPYRDWLGVTVPQRPLDHYGRLGLAARETNPARIQSAFEAQIAKLKPHRHGPNAPVARLLRMELELAMQCLLDPQTHAACAESSPVTSTALPDESRLEPALDESGPLPAPRGIAPDWNKNASTAAETAVDNAMQSLRVVQSVRQQPHDVRERFASAKGESNQPHFVDRVWIHSRTIGKASLAIGLLLITYFSVQNMLPSAMDREAATAQPALESSPALQAATDYVLLLRDSQQPAQMRSAATAGLSQLGPEAWRPLQSELEQLAAQEPDEANRAALYSILSQLQITP